MLIDAAILGVEAASFFPAVAASFNFGGWSSGYVVIGQLFEWNEEGE